MTITNATRETPEVDRSIAGRSTAHDYRTLMVEIDRLRSRWRLTHVGEGAVRWLALLALAVMAAVACDNLFWPGHLGRALLLAALCAVALAALSAWVLRRWLEDRRDDFFAALVEGRYPALDNRLINGLQLGRGNDHGSPRLITAIIHDALAATQEIGLPDAVDRRPLKRTAAMAGAVALVLLVYAASPRFANGLARVVRPLADIPPYTSTRVAGVTPGDRQVLEGQAVPVAADVAGVKPADAQLVLRVGEQPWKTIALRPLEVKPSAADATARFGVTLREASESFDYYVAAGDGRSRQYHLEVVKRPRIENLALTIAPPPYVQRPPQTTDPADGEVAALAGSVARLTLTATKPLKQARLVFDAGEPLELSLGDDERTWQASFAVWSEAAHDDAANSETRFAAGRRVVAPTRYRIQMSATDGSEQTDPLWRSITALDDQPPTVVVSQPGRDLQQRPDDMLAVEVVAKDDFGVGPITIVYRVHDSRQPRELVAFPSEDDSRTNRRVRYAWRLADSSLKPGDLVQYWAEAADRNDITGPGTARSPIYSLFIKTPEQSLAKLEFQLNDYALALEDLIRLQSENRAQTAADVAFETLAVREALIRAKTLALSRAATLDATPVATFTAELDDLYAGLMADCIRLLESGRDTAESGRAADVRRQALPLEDEIIERLKALLARLRRNEQARQALKKLEKTDKPAHAAIIEALADLAGDLKGLVTDERELADKFERLPKRPVDEANDEARETLDDLKEFKEKWNEWAKGKIAELTKLPTGFVDDFGLREDVNTVFEEIETAAHRPKAEKVEVALEDLGAGMATKMLEDLEVWMMDTPDAAKWVLEEPLNQGPLEVPEMPLPDALEDLVGDLLQEADEFDEEADDITSAWGDNLNQAGWGVSDGPISSFSAKGKTGNDLPNNMELSGRSGDGRRGKSSGQMVGDTSRALAGRKTPARVGNERYEPGKLKQQAPQDPNGATGGGKKAGAGRRGLQGGTPPDFVKDLERLSDKQAAVREKAEQVAQRLEATGVTTTRLTESIELMKSSERDLRDLRYEDAASKRRTALSQLKASLTPADRATAARLARARQLPPELRDELLQSSDEGYPEGYEGLLKNYFRALSEAD
jgi:hypothetical protein